MQCFKVISGLLNRAVYPSNLLLEEMRGEVAGDVDRVVFDDERLGVQLQHAAAQVVQFIFRNNRGNHQELRIGVGAFAVPIGRAAFDFLRDKGQDLALARDNNHIDFHVLIVRAVHHEGVDERENHRIDHNERRVGKKGVTVHDQADDQTHSADTKAVVLQADVDRQDVYPARRPSCPQAQTRAKACQGAPHQTHCQQVIHLRDDQPHRNERHRDGHRNDRDDRLEHEFAVDTFVRNQKKRQVDAQEDRASDRTQPGDVLLKHFKDNFGDAGKVADIQSGRDQEHVEGERVEQAPKNNQAVVPKFILKAGTFQGLLPGLTWRFRGSLRAAFGF